MSILPLGGRWRAKRDGGGLAGDHNIPNDRVEICQYVPRSDAERPHTLVRQPVIALRVAIGAEVMRFAVDLDTQPRRIAVEIEDVRACRMLTTKTEARLIAAQYPPENDFGQGHC